MEEKFRIVVNIHVGGAPSPRLSQLHPPTLVGAGWGTAPVGPSLDKGDPPPFLFSSHLTQGAGSEGSVGRDWLLVFSPSLSSSFVS